MIQAQNGNPNREALLVVPEQAVEAGGTYTWKLRTAGLVRFKVVVQRTAGSIASTFQIGVAGAVSNDVYYFIAPPTAIPAAALNQIVVVELTCVAHDIVAVTISNDNATGPTTLRVQLMATFT